MNRLERLYWTAKAVNWRHLPRRVLQAGLMRSGVLRRRLDAAQFDEACFRRSCRAAPAEQAALWGERLPRIVCVPDREMLRTLASESLWQQYVLGPAERALAGEYPFFSAGHATLGWPPQFNFDPLHQVRWPTGRHWIDIHGALPPTDIKIVWEPSRLTLAFGLARAWAVTGERRWAEAVWALLEAWIEQNPPELTVAWECGQEATFRLMAALLAAAATSNSPAATPERLEAVRRLAWQTGRHVSRNINQALMQGNNHGLSEATALWTVGLLFPELAEAEGWARRGAATLAHEAARQVEGDGSYAQNSTNYHRVMMDDLTWAVALGERSGRAAPEAVRAGLGRAAAFLAELLDQSGRTPNYGANDGANVLPLSCSDYLDYRPTLQAGWFAVHRRRLLDRGPWDEKLLWLFGPAALESPLEARSRRASWSAPRGGYYVLRGPRSWAMTRCHDYRSRPAQADMLHLDLWFGGSNVLRDGGSYSYRCPGPRQQWFSSTAAHNTVELDGQDQMVKGPRFLWFQWTRGRLLEFAGSDDGRIGFLAGEHYGYRRLAGGAVHRRMILRCEDAWLIVDDVLGTGRHEVALRWRMAPGDWQREGNGWSSEIAGQQVRLAVTVPTGLAATLENGREEPRLEGWESLYYGQCTAVPTVVVRGAVTLPVRLVTTVGPADGTIPEVLRVGTASEPLVLAGGAGVGVSREAVASLSGGRIRLE